LINFSFIVLTFVFCWIITFLLIVNIQLIKINNNKGNKMKFFKKSIIATVVAVTSMSSFAVSSQAGLDSAGNGVVHINGTAVGSCTAPTFSVNLDNIDFHNAKNGPTGVYQMPVNVSVTCSNPNQSWRIAPYVRAFSFDSGVNGQTPESGYVSFSAPNVLPGDDWNDNSDWDPQLTGTALETFLNRHVGAWGTGSSTYTSKLTFGKELNMAPADMTLYDAYDINRVTVPGGVPTGTIDGRGSFNVDIPLQIVY
jgi:hypothetical protein